MSAFAQGVMAGAGGMVVLIGLLVAIPLWLRAMRLRARGLD
ncbi:hypothetical protein [Komagataeibacter medellinensis]|nr:hypothetical protein [Komagataeibacter medellinensis]